MTLELTVKNAGNLVVYPQQLVFSPDNWYVPQLVRLAALDDFQLKSRVNQQHHHMHMLALLHWHRDKPNDKHRPVWPSVGTHPTAYPPCVSQQRHRGLVFHEAHSADSNYSESLEIAAVQVFIVANEHGYLWTMGCGRNGRLGHGSNDQHDVPTLVRGAAAWLYCLPCTPHASCC